MAVRVHCVDALYRSRGNYAAVYALISGNGEAALFDTGTPAHYGYLKNCLNKLGVTEKTLTKIIVSHVHMDHCGNTSLLARDFPKATIFAHPKSLRHLHDPSRLIQQTKAIMKTNYANEYGNSIYMIPKDRLVATEDGIELSETLKVLHTEGHSLHHISLFESSTRTMFTGDSYGTRYLEILDKPFVSTAPAAFDPDKMISSIRKMSDLGIARLALTHYGFTEDVEVHTQYCLQWISRMKEIAKGSSDDIKKGVFQAFADLYGNKLNEHIDRLTADINVNTMGVLAYAKRIKDQ